MVVVLLLVFAVPFVVVVDLKSLIFFGVHLCTHYYDCYYYEGHIEVIRYSLCSHTYCRMLIYGGID